MKTIDFTKPTINVFFDCEFTGLYKKTELLSIGLVTEGGRMLYTEINKTAHAYEIAKKNEWVRDNVLTHFMDKSYSKGLGVETPNYELYPDTHLFNIKFVLKSWLSEISDDGKKNIQLCADVGHYDMVLFMDIFEGAFNIPDNVSPALHDINQDIAAFKGISEFEAFELSREELLSYRKVERDNLMNEIKEFGKDQKQQHNALYDAVTEMMIYSIMNN